MTATWFYDDCLKYVWQHSESILRTICYIQFLMFILMVILILAISSICDFILSSCISFQCLIVECSFVSRASRWNPESADSSWRSSVLESCLLPTPVGRLKGTCYGMSKCPDHKTTCLDTHSKMPSHSHIQASKAIVWISFQFQTSIFKKQMLGFTAYRDC